MNTGQIDGRTIGGSWCQLLQESFLPVQRTFSFQVVGTGIVVAFVDGASRGMLPAIESPVTVWAPENGLLVFSAGARDLAQSGADFAADLGGVLAVVQIQVGSRRSATQAHHSFGDRFSLSTYDGVKSSTLLLCIVGAQPLPIQDGLCRGGNSRLGQRSQRVDVELAIVGMLVVKIVSGFDLGFSLREDLLKAADDFFQLLARELIAEPQNKSCYFGHGGLSPFDRRDLPLITRGWRHNRHPFFTSSESSKNQTNRLRSASQSRTRLSLTSAFGGAESGI